LLPDSDDQMGKRIVKVVSVAGLPEEKFLKAQGN
jgi:hypothetical protein